jgi:hypothetical protein
MTSGQLKICAVLLFLLLSFTPVLKTDAAIKGRPAPAPSTDPDEVKPGRPKAPPMIESTYKIPVDRALYLDLYTILADDNQCSRFFLGSGAIEVLNQLSRRLVKKPLNIGTIGLQMSGEYGNFENARTRYSYRMFEKAVLNTDGPFFRNICSYSQQCQRSVGRFGAATREGRILMMLHEMAHLIKNGKNGWLIPDDGNDSSLSMSNTLTVEKHCRDAIVSVVRRKQDVLFAGKSAKHGALPQADYKTIRALMTRAF